MAEYEYVLVPIRQQPLAKILMDKPLLPPSYKVGDHVTFINDYGVVWPGYVITGIRLYVGHEKALWQYYKEKVGDPKSGAYWCPVDEKNLCLE